MGISHGLFGSFSCEGTSILPFPTKFWQSGNKGKGQINHPESVFRIYVFQPFEFVFSLDWHIIREIYLHLQAENDFMPQNILIIVVFVILAGLDFVPMPFPARMILPLLWLTLCALCKRRWVLSAALFFSFMGDVMGWQNELIPQIGFFALAQILYIIILCLLMPPKRTWPKAVRIILLALVVSVYAIAMCWIFPKVEDGIVSCGIAVYAVLLLGMCYAALRHRNACLMLGAMLFVASDFILGVHLFVGRIPHSTLCIMLPYYLGQLLLFVGMMSKWRT